MALVVTIATEVAQHYSPGLVRKGTKMKIASFYLPIVCIAQDKLVNSGFLKDDN